MDKRLPVRHCQSRSSGRNGSVLIVVLLVISLLVVTVLESMRSMQVESASSKLFQTSFQGRSLTRSGLALARYLLARDVKEQEQVFDHYGETWAQFLRQKEVSLPELKTGELNGTLRDESGKLPINYLVDDAGEYRPAYRRILTRLLKQKPFELDAMEVEQILQPLKDWMDPDDLPTGEFGAEESYYAEQGSLATCPNGPLQALGELRYVKGLGAKLFGGSGDQPGLKDLCTVHTEGRININTAPPEILAAMVQEGIGPDTALEFARDAVSYRQERQHYDFLAETDWYRNRMAGYNDIQLPAHVAGVQSDFFAVRLQARTGAKTTSLFCLLRRSKADQEIRVRQIFKEML